MTNKISAEQLHMADHSLGLISKYRSAIMGLAALWIYFFHEGLLLFETSGSYYLAWTEGFIRRIGFCGVDFFFLLSGMGLCFSMAKNPKLLQFYAKRIRRIAFPFVAIAIVEAVYEGWPVTKFIKNITGFNFYTESIYSFLWFVPAIITIYLLFPFYYKLFDRAQNKYVFTVITVCIWLVLSVGFAEYIRIDFFGFTNRIPVFVIGVLFGWMIQNRNITIPKWSWLGILFVFLLGLYLSWQTIYNNMPLLVNSPECCIPNICIAVAGSFLVAKLLDIQLCSQNKVICKLGNGTNQVLTFVGGISLEFYCLQEWFGSRVQFILYKRVMLPAVVAKLVTILVVIAIAYAMRKFVLFVEAKIKEKRTS